MILPSPRSKRRARIEIIPLIDIIFFLLATFVMVSLSMVKNQGLPVSLPTASTGAPQVKNNKYTAITVDRNGDIYFDKQRIAFSELPARLERVKRADTDPTVVLNADEKAAYGRAISVLDEVRKSGIKKVSLETKQPL